MIAVRLDDIKITNSGGDGHQGNAKPNQAAIYLSFRRDAKTRHLTPKIVHVLLFFRILKITCTKNRFQLSKKNSRLISTSNEQEKQIDGSRTPV